MFKSIESNNLDKAQRRLKGLRYLKPDLDFGNGVSAQDFAIKTETMQIKLAAHNALVEEFTEKVVASREEIKQLDHALGETAERMLNTIAAIYGKTSDEYEMVGGTKRDLSKKKAEKTEQTAPAHTNSIKPIKISKNTAKTNGNGKENGKVAIA
jgi:hypothetical protein